MINISLFSDWLKYFILEMRMRVQDFHLDTHMQINNVARNAHYL